MLLFLLFVGASALTTAAEAAEQVYVSENGNDESGEGTATKPYATLAKAVTKADDGATIYVMSDLTITENARITDKNLIITSLGNSRYSITRGENFTTTSDNNQSFYNPGMIEVTTPAAKGASVTLKNIILNDNGQHEGTYFAQTNSSSISESNLEFVQDSMITAHGLSNASVKIILESGVVCSKRLLNQAVGKSLRTHNLKPKKGAQVMRKNEKITALYERLSRDDFGKDDDQQRESNSISNQKAMLEEFAARQGFTNIVHFTDDGISGTCFVEVR